MNEVDKAYQRFADRIETATLSDTSKRILNELKKLGRADVESLIAELRKGYFDDYHKKLKGDEMTDVTHKWNLFNGIPVCNKHGSMLSYGKHGSITIYRCEQVWGTHIEVWVHKNGEAISVKPHIYVTSEEGKKIINSLVI